MIDNYCKKKEKYLEGIGGTFTAVIIDFNIQTLYLSTDSVGQLKLYYKAENSEIHFSTQIAELVNNESVNKNGLIQYLLLDHYIDESTIYNSIKRITGGNTAVY